METLTHSQQLIAIEHDYGAHDYHPIPAVLERGEGVYLWDVEGKKYFDFLSAYSAVNQGHCHPRIVKALQKQAEVLTLTSRAFHNNKLGKYMEYITRYFNFERMLPSNTGAEAVEAVIKITRKWGYTQKNIPENRAEIIVCSQNFHGRTSTIISFSSDPDSKNHFGPHASGFISIPYNDIEALEAILETHPNIAGFLVEPIQGEAGVYTPDEDFLSKARSLCSKYNVLLITDEIQTGIGRTGSLLASCGNCSCEGHCERQEQTYTRPDILILGKAISGGTYPVSAVLCDSHIMDVIQPGQHGSTFGGNPMACTVAMEALEVIRDEKLTQNARRLGKRFRAALQTYIDSSSIVTKVRGKGLLNAIVINDSEESKTAWNICMKLKENGLLAKPTHGNIIRFAPPLVMTDDQLEECINIILSTLKTFEV
ncbi:MAG: ornithine--oxo-acid transaminase [Flavobacteriaceae bacterium]|nr:ornithine--oxo-acid transaminase [Flavobacteriaceae bacterium]MDG2503284.1 ornithine--oxo-acid transaminase [Flavobacteriaceae bacterium]